MLLFSVFVVALIVVRGLLSASSVNDAAAAAGGRGAFMGEEVPSSGGGCCCCCCCLCWIGGSTSLPNTSGFTLFLFSRPLRRCAAEEAAAVANCNMNYIEGVGEGKGLVALYNLLIIIIITISPVHHC